MTDYIVGDIHGHPQLIAHITQKFELSAKDCVYFLGDLVGKGVDDWGTLEAVFSQCPAQIHCLLGNHDLVFLAKNSDRSDLSERQQWLLDRWLQCTQLAMTIKAYPYLLAHAGAHPSWTLNKVCS